MTSRLAWFTSSYSGSEGGACVEVAHSLGAVHVRDSKDPAGPALVFTGEAWTAFVAFVADDTGTPVE